jgi:hypothetical protein
MARSSSKKTKSAPKKTASKPKRPALRVAKPKKVISKKTKPAVKKAVVKKSKPAPKPKKVVSKKISKVSKKSHPKQPVRGVTTEEIKERFDTLVQKGKKRRFVTFEEILKSFPDIEDDIMFLDDLYVKFNDAGIDVLESGNLLSSDPVENHNLTEFLENDMIVSEQDTIQFRCI